MASDANPVGVAYTRRWLLVTGGATALAGCGGSRLSGSATPPSVAFEVTAVGEDAVELRYTGGGIQDTTKFRVVLEGAGTADGIYALAIVTDDVGWTDDDRYVLNQTTLGLAEPLAVEGLTVALQYDDDGQWRTVVRTNPSV